MRPLSLDHLTIIEATPLELIQAAAAGGFEKVGLRIVRPTAAAAIVEVIGQPQLQRDLKALMASTGVSIGLIESIWLSPETNPSELEPALATSAELGAGRVLVSGNDPDEARLSANLAHLAIDARKYGLEIHAVYASPYHRTGLANLETGCPAQSPIAGRRAAFEPFGQRPADARQTRFLNRVLSTSV